MFFINTLQQINNTIMSNKVSLLQVQIHRYKRKGILNIFIGLVLLIVFLIGTYQIGKYYWPKQFHEKNTFYIVSTFVVHTACGIIFTLFYLPSYLGQIKLFERQRINQNNKWHWKRPDWPILKIKTIKRLCFIYFIIFPIFVWIGSLSYKGNFQFPTFKQFIFELLFGMLIEDLLFYWSHRLMHQPFLYKHIHKTHHQYDTPFSNSSQYAHPVEYIFGNMVPAGAGMVILGSRGHIFSHLMLVLIRMMNTFQNHSGIQFGWSPIRILPFSTSPSLHNFHHSINIGAYGSFIYLWDHFMGTNNQFYKQVYKLE